MVLSLRQVFNSGIKRQKTIKKSKTMRRYVIILGLGGILLYLFFNYNMNEDILTQGEIFAKNLKYNIQNNLKDDGYFVNLTGCKIPSFDFRYGITSSKIVSLPSITCNNNNTTLTATKNNLIYQNLKKSEIKYFYNITNIENISCTYQPFYRKNDMHNEYENTKYIFDLFKQLKLKSENYIKVMCSLNKTKIFYEYFHYPSIDNNISSKINNNHKISVMVIGFKDLSHYNFLRKMRKTTKLLRSDAFLTVEFFGLNRIGKSNFDNFLPFLSGFNEEELIASCLHPYQNQSYDQCPFIWKTFREYGYKTVFAEDVGHLSLFNYVRPGFLYPPTDFYTRPIIIEFEKLINQSKVNNNNTSFLPCTKISHTVDFILQTINNFIPQYLAHQFFSFYLFTSSNFILNNIPNIMDYELYSLILKLNDSNVLNKTILFFISDRGNEFGSYKNSYQGIMEERQPLLYAIIPKWFEMEYSDAINNFKNNAHKLTTNFDLHETLLDLTDLSTISNKQIYQRSKEILENDIFPRGISLFLNIPNQRSCEHASIPYTWCTCYDKQVLPTNNPKMQRAARYIILRLNEKIRDFPQCRTLHLNSILHATISSANKKVLKELEGEYISEVMLRIQTKPGLAEYEAIIRMTSYLSFLVGNITRINYNGKYSFCIPDNSIKPFCYCLR